MSTANSQGDENKIQHAVDAIKQLTTLFRTERLIYLIITLFSVVVLIITATSMLMKSESQENTIAIMGLFGSSGGIVYSAGRLLKMWSEAMQLITKALES